MMPAAIAGPARTLAASAAATALPSARRTPRPWRGWVNSDMTSWSCFGWRPYLRRGTVARPGRPGRRGVAECRSRCRRETAVTWRRAAWAPAAPSAKPRRMLPHALISRLSYANVVSSVCLFILLGGSAYAAVSITGKDVRDGSLTSADIKNHSLRARDFKASSLPAGPAGPKGDPGRDGAAGDPGAPVTEPPAAIGQPAGRLTLSGITGAGAGGAIEVRSGSPGRTSCPATRDVRVHGPARRGVLDAGVCREAPGRGEPRLQHGHDSNPVYTFDPSAPLAPLAELRVGQLTVDGIAGETDWCWTPGTSPTPAAPRAAEPPSSGASWSARASARRHRRCCTLRRRQAQQARHDQAAPARLDKPLLDLRPDRRRDLLLRARRERATAGADRLRRGEDRVDQAVPGGEPIRACFDRKLMAMLVP